MQNRPLGSGNVVSDLGTTAIIVLRGYEPSQEQRDGREVNGSEHLDTTERSSGESTQVIRFEGWFGKRAKFRKI
jgi:hypothetical protein